MNGQSYLESLPENNCSERDNLTLEAISNGTVIAEWSTIISTHKENTAEFQVSTDALYCVLEDGSRYRPTFSSKTAQQAAQLIGAVLPTTKLLDLRHLSSNKLNATLLPASSEMSSTSYSKQYNKNLEEKRNNYEYIVSDVGKPWLNSELLHQSAGAILYGFYDKSAPNTNSVGLKMWQCPPGTKHNNLHQDYSSTGIFIENICKVNGESMTILDLSIHPEFSYLWNYSGIIKGIL